MNLNEVETIIVYDVSAIIYVGAKSYRQQKWNYKGIPTGGLYTFLTYLTSDIKRGKNTAIVLCFDSPRSESLRAKMYSDYKANRNSSYINSEDYDISNIDDIKVKLDLRQLTKSDITNHALNESAILQLHLAMSIADNLKIPYLYQKGIEADDLIYSLCYNYPRKNILIRADDNDLIDAKLLNKNVSFLPITNKNINNNPTGQLFDKVFSGCKSDNIKGLGKDLKWNTLSNALRTGNLDPYQIKNLIVNNQFDLSYIQKLGYDEEDSKRIMENIYCVYPFIFNLSEEIFKDFTNDYDINKLIEFLSLFGMKKILKSYASDIIDNENIRQYRNHILSKISYILEYFLSES